MERVAKRLLARKDLEALVEAEWQGLFKGQHRRHGQKNREMSQTERGIDDFQNQKVTEMMVFSGTVSETLNHRDLSPPLVFGSDLEDPQLEERNGRSLRSKRDIDTIYAQAPQNAAKEFSFHKFVHHNQPTHWESGGVTLAQGMKFLSGMDKSLMVPSQHFTLPSQYLKDDIRNWGDKTFLDNNLKETREGQYPPFEVQLGFSVPVNHTTSLKFLNILQLNDYEIPFLDSLKSTVEVDREISIGSASSGSQANHFITNSHHPILNGNTMLVNVNPSVQGNKENPTFYSSSIKEAKPPLHQTFTTQTDEPTSSGESLGVSDKNNENLLGLHHIKGGEDELEYHIINPDLLSSVNIGSELSETHNISIEHITPKLKLQPPPLSLTAPPIEETSQIIESLHGIKHSSPHSGLSENKIKNLHGGTHTNNPAGPRTILDFFTSNTQDPQIHSLSRPEVNSEVNKDMETFKFLNFGNTVRIKENSDDYRLDEVIKDRKLQEISSEHGKLTSQLEDGQDQGKNIQIKDTELIGEKGLNIKRNEDAGGTRISQFEEIYSENIPGYSEFDERITIRATGHENIKDKKGQLWRLEDSGDRDRPTRRGSEMAGFHRRRGDLSATVNDNDVATMTDFRPNPQVFGEDPSAAIAVVVAPRFGE